MLLASCQKEKTTYLHIAHTRSYDGAKDKLMPEVEQIDFDAYDLLMLGGDLVYESTRDSATLNYLDRTFQLSNEDVLWTLGNHDYHHHPEWISGFTKRPNFYSYQKNGIQYLVLDSQADLCNTTGQQKELLERSINSLETDITHLIVLHHKLLWMMDDGPLQKRINEVSNGGAGNCFYCVPPNNFYSDVYPQLVEVQKRGVQVICIAGDIGAKVDEFEYETKEGIFFLASGLKDGSPSNKVLLFDHDIDTGKLDWQFTSLKLLPKRPSYMK